MKPRLGARLPNALDQSAASTPYRNAWAALRASQCSPSSWSGAAPGSSQCSTRSSVGAVSAALQASVESQAMRAVHTSGGRK